MKAYVYKANSDQFIGFIISKEDNKKISRLFLNTTIKTLEEVLAILNENLDINEIETTNIPKYILEWANKIISIRKGFDQDTSMIPLDYTGYTDKQKLVTKFCIKNIPVNEIFSYSKIAKLVGLPNAQRFVGTTMKKVRQPYIVPVHRVKSIKSIKKSDYLNYVAFSIFINFFCY